MKLSEKLWAVAQFLLDHKLTKEWETAVSAAVVVGQVEADTPRPWPPPAAAGHSRVDMSLHYFKAGDREVDVVEKIRRRVQ